jgi:hypothetical protein
LQAAKHVRKTTLFLILAIAIQAQAGEWGSRGVSRSFLVDGDRLFAADSRGVSVYDISTATPRRLAVATGDDETRDLALQGSTLLVATARGIDRFTVAANGALTRIDTFRDVRDVQTVAASPQLIAAVSGFEVSVFDPSFNRIRHFRFSVPIRTIAFVGELLYVSVSETAIFVFDPTTGEQLADLPVDASDFARAGSILWASSVSQGLVALDVSEPATPRIIGRTQPGVLKLNAVAASGTRVYAIELPDVTYVFDATNPADVKVASTMREWVHTIGAKDTRLFLAGTRIDAEGLPYETGVPVRVYDASNVASLRVAGQFNDLAGPVTGAWTDGSIAIVVDAPYLRVLDVSKSDAPRELSSVLVPDIQDHIRVKNGMAILYGRSNVNFVDVSDLYKPKYLGTWDGLGHPRGAAAFMRDTIVEANETGGFHIVDYSDPTNPRLIAWRIWHYHDVTAGDDAAYAFELLSFLTMDISDRNKVVVTETRNVDGYMQMDTVPPNSGSPQYLVWRGVDHLMLLSLVEDRFHPREIARIPVSQPQMFGTSASSIFISLDGAISRIDLADPSFRPVEIGWRALAPQQIAAAGEKVVIADRYSVRIFGPDTAPPPPPPPPPGKRRASRH